MSQPMGQWPEATLGAEHYVRRVLGLLEADFRSLTLRGLALWEASGIVSPALFEALGNLQRPSFGSFKGLLDALRKARSSASRGQEQEAAPELGRLLELLDQRLPREVIEALRPLAELCRTKVSGLTLLGVLAMPIALRNDIAHQTPGPEAPLWGRAAEALAPLVELHKAGLMGLGARLQELPPAAPWFVTQESRVLSFNGLTHDYAARFSGAEGDPLVDEDLAGPVLRAIARMLGEADAGERELKKLLKRLAPEELRGVVLDDYLVGRSIGEGGFATVHLARQLSTGRRVAVKILRDSATAEDAARFQKEAEFLSLLNHPNIVQVIGYGEGTWLVPRNVDLSGEAWFEPLFARGKPAKTFIALQWIEGRTLEEVWKQVAARDAQSPKHHEITHWLEQAAQALHVVHGVGLIHRDIKPSNLMVTTDGTLKLMDFGIARAQNAARTIQTRSGEAPGTLAYMSPEQLRMRHSEAGVGTPTDVYSLCATFYELYTGTRFFEWDLDETRVSQNRLEETSHYRREHAQRPAAPAIDVAGAGPEVRALLQGGLEPEPKDRPSAGVLASDIALALANRPISYRPPGTARRLQLAYRRNPLLWNAVAAFVVMAALGVAAYIWSITEEQARTAVQRDIALKKEAEARRQETIARENEAEAKRQQKIASDNAAEAQIQRKAAQDNADKEAKERARAEANEREAVDNLDRAHLQSLSLAKSRKDWETLLAHAYACAPRKSEGKAEARQYDSSVPVTLWSTLPGAFGRMRGTFCASPDCRLLAGPVGQDVVVWDAATGDELAVLPVKGARVLFADNARLAVVLIEDDEKQVSRIECWSVARRQRMSQTDIGISRRHYDETWTCAPFAPLLMRCNGPARYMIDLQTGLQRDLREVFGRAFLEAAPLPDGSAFVVLLPDHRLAVIDMYGKELRSLGPAPLSRPADPEEAALWRMQCMQVSPEGNFVLMASSSRHWGVLNLANLVFLASGDPVQFYSTTRVAWSLDGTRACAVAADRLQFVDVQSATMLFTERATAAMAQTVHLSPDGEYLICCNASQTPTWYRFRQTEAACTYRETIGGVTRLAVSPDLNNVAVVDSGSTPRVLGLKDGELVFRQSVRSRETRAIAFSPDGEWLYTLTAPGKIYRSPVYEDGEDVVLAEFGANGAALGISGDGARICVVGLRSGALFDTGTGRRTAEFACPSVETSPVVDVAFSASGAAVYVASEQAILRIDAASGRVLSEVRGFKATHLALDGVNDSVLLSSESGHVSYVWADNLQPRASAQFGANAVKGLDVCEGKAWVAWQESISIYTLPEREAGALALVQVLSRSAERWSAFALCPGPGLALVGRNDGSLSLLEYAPRVPPSLPLRKAGKIVIAAASPGGEVAAAAIAGAGLEFWDLRTHRPLHDAPVLARSGMPGSAPSPILPTSLVFTPDGRKLVALAAPLFFVFDTASGATERWGTLMLTNLKNGLAVNGDATRLLLRRSTSGCLLYDTVGDKVIREFAVQTHPPSDYEVLAMSFVAGDEHALFVDNVNGLTLWNVVRGTKLADLSNDAYVAFLSRDRAKVMYSLPSRELVIYDLKSQTVERRFHLKPDENDDYALAAPDRFLAGLPVRDAQSGEMVELDTRQWVKLAAGPLGYAGRGLLQIGAGVELIDETLWPQIQVTGSTLRPGEESAALLQRLHVRFDGVRPIRQWPACAGLAWEESGGLPGFLKPAIADAPVAQPRTRWGILENVMAARRSRAVENRVSAYRRWWNEQFEGFRVGVPGQPAPSAREKDALGRYVGDIEGVPDLPNWLRARLPHLWLERARHALERHDWRLAVKAFSWPLELGAGDETACRLGRAHALLALQQWEPALEDLDFLVARDSKGRDLLMLRCRARSQNGNLEGALADVMLLLERGLDEASAANLRGEFQETAGNNDEALKQYALAIEGDPGSARPRFNRGRLHERTGNHEAALADYQAAIKRIGRNRPEELYPAKMGAIRILNRFKRFSEAIALVPGDNLETDADAVEVAMAFYGSGNAQAARDWFKSAADYRPRNAAARAWQAYAEADLGRIMEGAAAAEDACIEDPDLDFALCARAWVAVQSNQTATALRDCRAALALNANSAEAWRILACVRMQRGELDEALACARKAVTLEPGSCFCLYTLGAVLAQQSLGVSGDEARKLRDAALTQIELAFAAGRFWKSRALRDGWLVPLRDDPRFQKLIKP